MCATPGPSTPSAGTTTPNNGARRTDDVAALVDRIIPGFGFGQAFKDASKALEREDPPAQQQEQQQQQTNGKPDEERYTAEEKGKAPVRPPTPTTTIPTEAKTEETSGCKRCEQPCATGGNDCGQCFQIPGYNIQWIGPFDGPKFEDKADDKQALAGEAASAEAAATLAAPAEPASSSEPESVAQPEAAPAATATKPARPVDTTPASPESDAAANLIQQQYRKHRFRLRRLEKLESLRAKLDQVIADFAFPASLDFATPSSVPSSPSLDPVDGAVYDDADHSLQVPPLAFTPANQAYHAHAHALLQLLTAADSIPSDGDKEVRKARKDFVKRVESKLAEMEVKRSAIWKETQEKDKAAGESTPEAAPSAKQTASPSESRAAPDAADKTVEDREEAEAAEEQPVNPLETPVAPATPEQPGPETIAPAAAIAPENPASAPRTEDAPPKAATVEDDSDEETLGSRHSASSSSDDEQDVCENGTKKVDEFVLV